MCMAWGFTWKVGGLSKWVISRLVSTQKGGLKGVLIGGMILISLSNNYILRPPDPPSKVRQFRRLRVWV